AMTMTRREFAAACAACVPAVRAHLARAAAGTGADRPLGLVAYCFSIRLAADRSAGTSGGLNDPLAFVEHCHKLGAAGVQIGIGPRDKAYVARLREKVEACGMYLEGIVSLPRDQADVDRFTRAVQTAMDSGAKVLRTVTTRGRRYEVYNTAADVRRA